MPFDEESLYPILSLFDAFITECRYLQNVSPGTLDWYACSRRAFHPYERHAGAEIRIPRLKTLKKVLEVLTDEQDSRLIAYSPTTRIERRIHAMTLLIPDTDCKM